MIGRPLVFALIVSIGSSSMALAGEGLLQSGSRIVAQAVQTKATVDTQTATDTRSAGSKALALVNRIDRPLAASSTTAQQTLSESGMKKRNKVLLFIAIGAGFAGAAYAIDHSVLDITPSSLGQRRD